MIVLALVIPTLFQSYPTAPPQECPPLQKVTVDQKAYVVYAPPFLSAIDSSSGIANVIVRIDATGKVLAASIDTSTTNTSNDAVAIAEAKSVCFSPAVRFTFREANRRSISFPSAVRTMIGN